MKTDTIKDIENEPHALLNACLLMQKIFHNAFNALFRCYNVFGL